MSGAHDPATLRYLSDYRLPPCRAEIVTQEGQVYLRRTDGLREAVLSTDPSMRWFLESILNDHTAMMQHECSPTEEEAARAT